MISYTERTYSISRHRSDCRKNENDADEQCPKASPCVNKLAKLSHVPWAGLEFSEDELAARSTS